MSTEEKNRPIFIHSLWRAGSTYLFNVFRRSHKGYWCYQEPLNEIALLGREFPQHLLEIVSEKTAGLRHPELAEPYFQELYETRDSWRDAIAKKIVYDDYFGFSGDEDLHKYLRALIGAARARPVIQECRTSCRIATIRNAIDSTHLCLWRNPWDQWWSFKINDYFDAACQIIIGANARPPVISRLREQIGFVEYHDEDIVRELRHYENRKLTSENSYLVFYTLWCLGLIEGIGNADLLMNIDRLGESPSYRARVIEQMRGLGISGLDFSDCFSPQGRYDETDRKFFSAIEERVHLLLAESGHAQSVVDNLLKLRHAHLPGAQRRARNDAATIEPATDSGRVRDAFRRLESATAVHANERAGLIDGLNERIRQLESDWHYSRNRVDELTANLDASRAETERLGRHIAEREQAHRVELEAGQQRIQQLESDWRSSLARVSELGHQAAERDERIRAMSDSWSWRLTAPARHAANWILRRLGSRDVPIYTSGPPNPPETAASRDSIAQPGLSMSKTLLRFKPSSTRRHRVEDFLPFDDEAFVEAAYLGLLGRMPDESGMEHFLGRLRAGESKLEILANIGESQEGKEAGARVGGLKFRRKLTRLSRRPVLGVLVRSLFRPVLLPVTNAYCRVGDFSDLYDEEFIGAAYQAVLRRLPDPTGHAFYLHRLRHGAEKVEILGGLRYSREGKKVGVIVDGLLVSWTLGKILRLPLIGAVLKFFAALIRLPRTQREHRIMENYVMGVVATGRLKSKPSERSGSSGAAYDDLSHRTIDVLIDLKRTISKK